MRTTLILNAVLGCILCAQASGQEFKVTERDQPAFKVRPRVHEISPVGRPKLYVTSAKFHCPPCRLLESDRKAGRLNQFEFPKYNGTDDSFPVWNGFVSYPAIRFQEPDGSWKVIYGYNEAIRQQLIQRLIPDQQPVAEMPRATAPAKPANVVRRNPSLFGQIGTSHESRETLIDHLLRDGIHRGKRSLQQLQAMSDDELNAAHMKDHGW
ncbi:MAG: hypothetical protein E6R03_10450 [Hyphomicrobiaceae bacterium]|nr:MAG: hypothetical protein E6R03_10450 [Hyphomicrobiaceae bacterium]